MSHIGWIPGASGRQRRPSLWRFFPLGVVVAMGIVVAVNAGMIYAALSSFPGAAGDDRSFALSNHYDVVLDQARRDAALGWNVTAGTDAAGRPIVAVTGRDGRPLGGATIAGSAVRPLGAADTHALAFHETEVGRYVADRGLPMPGQWELTLSIASGGHDLAATRRIIVR